MKQLLLILALISALIGVDVFADAPPAAPAHGISPDDPAAKHCDKTETAVVATTRGCDNLAGAAQKTCLDAAKAAEGQTVK